LEGEEGEHLCKPWIKNFDTKLSNLLTYNYRGDNIAKRPLEKPQIKSPSGERARAL
jgi:hypothetical protein